MYDEHGRYLPTEEEIEAACKKFRDEHLREKRKQQPRKHGAYGPKVSKLGQLKKGIPLI